VREIHVHTNEKSVDESYDPRPLIKSALFLFRSRFEFFQIFLFACRPLGATTRWELFGGKKKSGRFGMNPRSQQKKIFNCTILDFFSFW